MLRFFVQATLFLCCTLLIIPIALAQTKYTEKVLQSVANLDHFQSTEGNQIRLIQTVQGCRIEAIFYGETGRSKENFLFSYSQNQLQLQKAARYEYHYSHGGLSNLSDNHGKFSTSVQRIELDPKALEQQKSFKAYLKLFPLNVLRSCHATDE